MNFFAFMLFLFGLQAVCLVVGRKSSKGMASQEDYFLAGKGIRFFPLLMTFIATQIGGGLILGSAEEAYRVGWSVLLYPLGQSLGFVLLGLGVGRKLAQFKVSTIAQIFEVAYGSVALKKLASLFSMASLFLIFVAQVIASNKFMLSLGVDSRFWFMAFWGIVIFYTAMGGLKAVVATDIIQATFFLAAFIICFGYVVYASEVPMSQLVASGEGSRQFSVDPEKLCGWLLMPLLFMAIEQDMGQRCFAAESTGIITRATWCAAGVTFGICLIPVSLGILARHLQISVPEGASVLMTMLKQASTPTLTALAGCAILAAIISTADSLLNAIGSNLSQDFDLPFLKSQHIRCSQALTATIALLGIAVSFSFDNVVGVMIQSYELSVCCLFVPIIAALYWKQGSALPAALAMLGGAVGFVLFRLVPAPLPKELAGVLLSFVGFGLGKLLARNQCMAMPAEEG